MKTMTNRERLLAVLQGREHDQVPFVQYDNCASLNRNVWELLGRNAMGILRWSSATKVEYPNCSIDSEYYRQDGLKARRNVLRTPKGALTEEVLYEPMYGAGSIKKHYVGSEKDYPVLLSYLRDVVVLPDPDHLAKDDWDMGDDGLPHVAVQRSPYQQLWIQWVALEDLVLHLADFPDLMAEVIGELDRIQRDIFRIVAKAPVPYVVFPDNITAPPIGEANFRKYCIPQYTELAGMLADRKIPVFVHMDGYLKPLWKAIAVSGVEGMDSMSPPPDNDTGAGDAVREWPRMRVFLNFPSSVHVADPAEVYRRTQTILQEAGHSGRLEIQLSENIPPGYWRRSFPQIARAIREFGRP